MAQNLKRRLHEIDTIIELVFNRLKRSESESSNQFRCQLNISRIKRERLRAMSAYTRSQQILNEMDVLVAENQLHMELADLNNNTRRCTLVRSSPERKTQEKNKNEKQAKQQANQKPTEKAVKPNDCNKIMKKKVTNKKAPNIKNKAEKDADKKMKNNDLKNKSLDSPVSRNNMKTSVKRKIVFEDDLGASTTVICFDCTDSGPCNECKITQL